MHSHIHGYKIVKIAQTAVILCGWGVKVGMVREWVAGKTV